MTHSCLEVSINGYNSYKLDIVYRVGHNRPIGQIFQIQKIGHV